MESLREASDIKIRRLAVECCACALHCVRDNIRMSQRSACMKLGRTLQDQADLGSADNPALAKLLFKAAEGHSGKKLAQQKLGAVLRSWKVERRIRPIWGCLEVRGARETDEATVRWRPILTWDVREIVEAAGGGYS
ncbi:hypothetical protein DOTSEDRAFT_156087 [Dothistroma septosporum NZE10]|uniref:Uncharacterized protein n=1 Tax=Dothistroma septosporum (strain NZE10 / CBS 128990) TaxID=675120 RepID=N1PFC2_DOTSN|nr:hypothetical protein DOTSEDRAFT_156087 [Dothistroma septosporum NZE10]